MDMVTGLFRDTSDAERACRAVMELGYKSEDINVVMSKDAQQRFFPPPSPTVDDSVHQHDQTAATADETTSRKLGGALGGTMSTLAPVLAAVGVMMIPGLGIVAGPLAMALAAAGAVGVAGGIVGMLTDWGIPQARIKQYEDGILGGGILLGVKPRSEPDAGTIRQRWREGGGEFVQA